MAMFGGGVPDAKIRLSFMIQSPSGLMGCFKELSPRSLPYTSPHLLPVHCFGPKPQVSATSLWPACVQTPS